jgi:cob(I)alamin adenosyltransferase
MKKGLLIVNTGNGKGKTTAALGLAMRALGQGFPVCIIQFIKGSWKYGELFSFERFNDLLDFHVCGKGFTFQSKDIEEDRAKAMEAWKFAKNILASDRYRMVILDELTYLATYNFIDEKEIIETLSNRRSDLHVVVTGRNASRSLIDIADLVTEMKSVKHPFETGVKAQKGIEF